MSAERELAAAALDTAREILSPSAYGERPSPAAIAEARDLVQEAQAIALVAIADRLEAIGKVVERALNPPLVAGAMVPKLGITHRVVHRARGIEGEARYCPQCKAAPGEPCTFPEPTS